MPRPTIAKHDCLHHGCPAEIVDVIKRGACLDERLHDAIMPEMGGCDLTG